MSTTSRIQQVTMKFRAQLLAHEATAERVLNNAHLHTLAAIKPALDKLMQDIAQAQQNGETVPASFLYERNRLQTLKQLIQHQIDHYSALAQMQAGQMQHVAVQLGQQAGMQQLQATVPPGIHYAFGVPHPAAIANIVGVTQAGSPLADLFNGFGEEAANGAAKALIRGVSMGSNPRAIARDVEDALGVSRARAVTICANEMNRCYKSAALETYRQNDDTCSGWQWQAALSPTSCALCIAMSGTKHSLDEDFASHVRCRCAPVPLTRSWEDILGIDGSDIPDTRMPAVSGIDWFDEQDEETQRSILGSNAAFNAFKDGAFNLKDTIGVTHDVDWGMSRYQKSLRDILGSKDAQQYYASKGGK
jgi:SPP1 gp7 family putative phage head morphogenesis protein